MQGTSLPLQRTMWSIPVGNNWHVEKWGWSSDQPQQLGGLFRRILMSVHHQADQAAHQPVLGPVWTSKKSTAGVGPTAVLISSACSCCRPSRRKSQGVAPDPQLRSFQHAIHTIAPPWKPSLDGSESSIFGRNFRLEKPLLAVDAAKNEKGIETANHRGITMTPSCRIVPTCQVCHTKSPPSCAYPNMQCWNDLDGTPRLISAVMHQSFTFATLLRGQRVTLYPRNASKTCQDTWVCLRIVYNFQSILDVNHQMVIVTINNHHF